MENRKNLNEATDLEVGQMIDECHNNLRHWERNLLACQLELQSRRKLDIPQPTPEQPKE